MPSAHPLKLTLVRHGQTDLNFQNAFIGVTDCPLNSVGRDQAGATARFLQEQGWDFDIMLTSPLQRCQETARIIGDLVGQSFAVAPSLVERDYGEFEGLTRGQVAARYPTILADYLRNKPFLILPGGESAIDVETRVKRLLWEIIPSEHAKAAKILVITHLNPVRATLRLLGLKSWDVYFRKFANASVTRLTTDLAASAIELYDYSCYDDPACPTASGLGEMSKLK